MTAVKHHTHVSQGAALWNCATASPENPERMAAAFRAGTGGLHSAEN